MTNAKNMLLVSIGLSAACVYTYFYFRYYVKKPQLYCKKNTKLHSLIESNLTALNKRYWPLFWAYESRLITVARALIQPLTPSLKFTHEICESKDGGHFSMHWACCKGANDNTPVVVIVPGITSTYQTHYVKSIVHCLVKNGYKPVVVAHRGTCDLELKTKRTYCATHIIDLEAAINLVRNKYPKAQIFGLGMSLGGIIMAQYLTEMGENCFLKGAVVYSCPFHPHINCKRLEHIANYFLINQQVASTLKRNYSRHRHLFTDMVDHDLVMNSKGIKGFDDAFTAPVFGYDNAHHYYAASRVSKERLTSIRTYTLCVNADDDIFSEESTLPKNDIANTDYVAMVMTNGGGHVSHMQGFYPFNKTYFEEILIQYYDALLKS